MDRNLTPRYYRVRDLQTIFGKPTVKATRSIYRQPGFPDPIRIGREYLWRIDAVERFIADHPTGRVQRAPRPSPRASPGRRGRPARPGPPAHRHRKGEAVKEGEVKITASQLAREMPNDHPETWKNFNFGDRIRVLKPTTKKPYWRLDIKDAEGNRVGQPSAGRYPSTALDKAITEYTRISADLPRAKMLTPGADVIKAWMNPHQTRHGRKRWTGGNGASYLPPEEVMDAEELDVIGEGLQLYYRHGRLFAVVAAALGLRQGELFAMPVEYLDVAGRRYRVHDQWNQKTGSYTPPKHGKRRTARLGAAPTSAATPGPGNDKNQHGRQDEPDDHAIGRSRGGRRPRLTRWSTVPAVRWCWSDSSDGTTNRRWDDVGHTRC